MSSAVISVDKLGKRYQLGAKRSGERYTALRDVLSETAKSLVRRNRWRSVINETPDSEFWALKDVSFEVRQGEVIGIIGRNGAGKSTLLKVLSRITEPTEGVIRIRGRIASLLEVGTGFHPELTGRENIFLNGAILGMHRSEIKNKFDEIVSFAEVERFLDTPVKRYSSGMYVRLAFAVAAHLEPEILVIDEVLAVGDLEFQKKCLGKMKDIAKSDGRTVLFVSHNMSAVVALCSSGIFLRAGRLAMAGTVAEATQAYLTHSSEQGFSIEFDPADPSAGDDVIRVRGARILDKEGSATGNVSVEEEVFVAVVYDVFAPSVRPRVNLHFSTDDGAYAFASIENTQIGCEVGTYMARMRIPPHFLNAKGYLLSIYVSSFQPTRVHGEMKDVLVLNVVDHAFTPTRQGYQGPFPGAVRPLLDWSVERQ